MLIVLMLLLEPWCITFDASRDCEAGGALAQVAPATGRDLRPDCILTGQLCTGYAREEGRTPYRCWETRRGVVLLSLTYGEEMPVVLHKIQGNSQDDRRVE